MTPCTGIPAERCVEPYLQGTLPENEARSFEEHYFDCPVCLAQVEALQIATRTLAREPLPPPRRVMAWPMRYAAAAAIAAALLLGIVGFLHLRATHSATAQPMAAQRGVMAPQPQPAPLMPQAEPPSNTLASLADLSLPAYQAEHLRGAEDSAKFTEGMSAYSRHDCPLAVKLLAKVPTEARFSAAAQFYTGVCQMHLGHREVAASRLGHIAAAGDSPQQEAALYYLGQLALAQDDAAAAKRDLSLAVSLHGDFERRARAELSALDKISESR